MINKNYFSNLIFIERNRSKMKDVTITDSIIYIGADDKDIRLFESQYEVPNGMAYNSYFIKDEKKCLIVNIKK